jgi:hypothetical protein
MPLGFLSDVLGMLMLKLLWKEWLTLGHFFYLCLLFFFCTEKLQDVKYLKL